MSSTFQVDSRPNAFEVHPRTIARLQVYLLVALGTLLFSSHALAENKVLYVHGKNDMYCYNGTADRCYKDGSYDSRYWGGQAGPTIKSSAFYVGYNATSDPREWGLYVNGFRLSDSVYTGDGPAWNRAQSQIHAALFWGSEPTYGGAACNDENNYCTLACHSAGCYAIDYYFSNFHPDWEKQAGKLNVYWTYAVASATGGSELADNRYGTCATVAANAGQLSKWPSDERDWPMTAAMRTAQARSFNHHETAGRGTTHYAGRNSGPAGYCTDSYFGMLNDGALAFHSQCAYEKLLTTNNCFNDPRGDCFAWTSCPWYWPLCTRYCTDFRPYKHWSNHYVDQYANVGVDGWSGTSYSYDKTHAQMKFILKTVVQDHE